MMRLGKCRICKKEGRLTEHHLIPKRLRPKGEKINNIFNQVVLICDECHRKIHPENEIILRVKQLSLYHKVIAKFLKLKHPKVWKEWQPFRAKIKKMYDSEIEKCK